MVLIRALAYHAHPRGKERLDQYFEGIRQRRSTIRDAERSITTEVWTKRLVLPCLGRVSLQGLPKISDQVQDLASEMGMDYAALPIGKVDPKEAAPHLARALSETETVFFNIEVAGIQEDPTGIDALALSELFFEIAEKVGPECCVKFSLAYGRPPETPYFPDTASRGEGISMSLRYVGDLQKEAEKGRKSGEMASLITRELRPIDEQGGRAAKESGLRYLGIDASLSPWMEESVAKLVEHFVDGDFGGVGSHHAIHHLNTAISDASTGMRTTGFNEVMLPLAEDNRLKELASEGALSVADLVSLISVSVVGLDMVLVPLSTQKHRMAKLLLDVFSIAYRRKKSVGVRLLLADAMPGDSVKLGRFGEVPVLPI